VCVCVCVCICGPLTNCAPGAQSSYPSPPTRPLQSDTSLVELAHPTRCHASWPACLLNTDSVTESGVCVRRTWSLVHELVVQCISGSFGVVRAMVEPKQEGSSEVPIHIKTSNFRDNVCVQTNPSQSSNWCRIKPLLCPVISAKVARLRNGEESNLKMQRAQGKAASAMSIVRSKCASILGEFHHSPFPYSRVSTARRPLGSVSTPP
jgi:hypothetical protein